MAQRRFDLELLKIVLGGAGGLGLGCLLLYVLATKQNAPPPSKAVQPIAVRPLPPEPPPPPAVRFEPIPVPARTRKQPPVETKPQPLPPVVALEVKVQPPPAPKPVDVLALLPATTELPLHIATEPQVLAALPAALSQSIEFHVHKAGADIPDGSAIYTQMAKRNSWGVYFAPDLSADVRQQLAVFEATPQAIVFRWTEPFDAPAVRQQLCNAVLEVRYGGKSRLVTFRTPKVEGPALVDLNKATDQRPYELKEPPKQSTLIFELADLAGFPEGAVVRGNTRTIPLGKKLIVEFEKMPGAEIEVRFNKHAQGVAVALLPIFRENSVVDFEMTYERLAAIELAATETVAKANADIDDYQDAYRAIESDLQDLLSQRPENPTQQGAMQRLAGVLRTKLKTANTRIVSAQKRLRDATIRLDALPGVKRFLDSVHGKGELRWKIYAESGGHQVLLVEAK